MRQEIENTTTTKTIATGRDVKEKSRRTGGDVRVEFMSVSGTEEELWRGGRGPRAASLLPL